MLTWKRYWFHARHSFLRSRSSYLQFCHQWTVRLHSETLWSRRAICWCCDMSVAQLPLGKRWWPIIDCVLTLQNQGRYVSKKLFVCYHFLLYNFLIFPMWSSLTCLKVHFLLFQQERSPVFRPHSFLSTCKDRVVPNMMCLVFKEVNHGNHFPFYPFALLFPGSTQPAAIFISTFFAPDFWFPFILLLSFFSVVRSHMLLSPFSRITSYFHFVSLRFKASVRNYELSTMPHLFLPF